MSRQARDAGVAGSLNALAVLSHPVPGMVAGAVLGFSGYMMQPGLNRDTLAPALLAVGLGLVGLLLGGLLSRLTGWALTRVWQRGQASNERAAGWPALLNALLWLGLFYLAQAAFSGGLQRPPERAVAPLQPHLNACQQLPPTEARERKSWDQECR